jgi:hypothetical protein
MEENQIRNNNHGYCYRRSSSSIDYKGRSRRQGGSSRSGSSSRRRRSGDEGGRGLIAMVE